MTAVFELLAQILARPRLRERYRQEMWEPAAALFGQALARREADGAALYAPADLAARIIMSAMLGLMLMGLADERLYKLMTTSPARSGVDVRAILWRGLQRGEET